MTIIPAHHNKSERVKVPSQIRDYAKELLDFAENGPFEGLHQKCYALHHSQVDQTPLNFFALNKFVLLDSYSVFPSLVIVNPAVLSGTEPYWADEGCMTFPHRQNKSVQRYRKIRARYQIVKKGIFGERLVTVNQDLKGLPAQIFQHETDHGNGRYVYDEDRPLLK